MDRAMSLRRGLLAAAVLAAIGNFLVPASAGGVASSLSETYALQATAPQDLARPCGESDRFTATTQSFSGTWDSGGVSCTGAPTNCGSGGGGGWTK